MSRLPSRLPSYAVLSENANAATTDVGATTMSGTVYYDNVANGGTVISASITLTKKAMVVVTALSVIYGKNTQVTQIQRGGVNKTEKTTISPANFAAISYTTGVPFYGHLQYATEVLEAGTYTYNLVNTSGETLSIAGSVIQIVAVAA